MRSECREETEFYSMKFFLNMSMGKDPGHAIVMVAIPHKKLKDLEMEMNFSDFLIIEKAEADKPGLELKLYREGELYREYDFDDILKRNIYISSAPLREDIWDLPKDIQSRTIEHIKLLESAFIVGQKGIPATDINRLNVVLDEYSFEEEKSEKRYFAQIQNVSYLGNTTYLG